MKELYIEIIERDNNIPPEKSILVKPRDKTIKEPELYTKALLGGKLGNFELTGTIGQHRNFEYMREIKDEELFPRFLTMKNLLLLALDCGLSVKKDLISKKYVPNELVGISAKSFR